MNRNIRSVAMALTLALSVGIPRAAGQDSGSPEEADVSERYTPPSIQFAPCPENPSLECGKLILPFDYKNPRPDETFGMAVIRAKATNSAKRIGVLFSLPCGPGNSGIDFVLAGVQAPAFLRLRERFDIVSFDVRGSHRSRPVRCQMEPSGDPEKVKETELVAFFDDLSRRIARACLDQNGPFILSMSSNNIARDIDMLRRALGERQITAVGVSFGTSLGAVYASRFPQRIRAMLLDSSVAPVFRDFRVEFRAEQAASLELVFLHLDQLCRRDPACRLRDPGLVPVFDQVKARLTTAPVTSQGVVLDGDAVATIVASLLPAESLWPEIVNTLADARGNNYTRLFQLLAFTPSLPVFGASTFDAFTAITCNDFGTRRSAAEYLPFSEAAGALYNRIESRFTVAASTARCAAWPAADVPIIHNVKDRVKTPILLVGSHFDPLTPLSWTRSLAYALGMEQSVFRYQGGGHRTYAVSGNACVDAIGDAYLFDLTLPAEGSTCPAKPIRFGP